MKFKTITYHRRPAGAALVHLCTKGKIILECQSAQFPSSHTKSKI